MDRPEAGPVRWLPLLVLGGVVAALVVAVVVSGRPPDGPVAADWDGTRCARCGMLVSEPAFAAQLHLKDGSVLHFDDPGCLLLELEEVEPGRRHAVWLHHVEHDEWLRLDQAAFTEVPHSPMGYGLGAVAAGEGAGVLSVPDARARLLEGLRAAEGLAREPGRDAL